MPLSNASEGGFIRNRYVSEGINLKEFLFRQGMLVPIRLKVRLEAFPKGIPMSVCSNYQYPGLSNHCNRFLNSTTFPTTTTEGGLRFSDFTFPTMS
jgi:hypothetical protein